MISEWSDPQLAQLYAQKAANADVNWYEYEVNLPAIIQLISSNTKTLLDYGCGAGDITEMLSKKYELVEGSDPSPAMIAMAKKDYPSLSFFEWDGTKPQRNKSNYYDTVFSKLAIHFVDDLNVIAPNIHSILRDGGSFIFSVPHPISTVRKTGGEYWKQTPYPTEIGTYGIKVTMIHRSLQEYIQPFVNNGFALVTLDEPQISADIAKKYELEENELALPKRLNLRFKKVGFK